jgi:hypothetical protein
MFKKLTKWWINRRRHQSSLRIVNINRRRHQSSLRIVNTSKVGAVIFWLPKAEVPKNYVWCTGKHFKDSDVPEYALWLRRHNSTFIIDDETVMVPDLSWRPATAYGQTGEPYCDMIVKVHP